MGVLFANRFKTTLASGVTAGATSMTVASATGLPAIGGADYCYLTLVSADQATIEVVKATAVAGSVITITRAQDGTTGVAWASGTAVELRLTKLAFSDALAEKAALSHTHIIGNVTGLQTALDAKANLAGPNTFINGHVFRDGLTLGRGVGEGIADTGLTLRNTNYYNNITFQSGVGSDASVVTYGNMISSPAIGLFFDFDQGVTFRNYAGTQTRVVFGSTGIALKSDMARFEGWKDATPTKAFALGMAIPGNTNGDDMLFSGYNSVGGWYEYGRFVNSTKLLQLAGGVSATTGNFTGDVTTSGYLQGNEVEGKNLIIDDAAGTERNLFWFTAGSYVADIALQTDNVTLKHNVPTKHRFDVNGSNRFNVTSTGVDVAGNATLTGTAIAGNFIANAASGNLYRSYYFYTAGAYSADIGLNADDVTLHYNTASMHVFQIGAVDKFYVSGTQAAFKLTTVYVNTDKLLLQHDGSNGYIRAQTGALLLGAGGNNVVTVQADQNLICNSQTLAMMGTTGSGAGHVKLDAGNASNSGYISWFTAGGTRVGYLGYADASNINMVAEAGRSWNIVGNAYFNNNVYLYSTGANAVISLRRDGANTCTIQCDTANMYLTGPTIYNRAAGHYWQNEAGSVGMMQLGLDSSIPKLTVSGNVTATRTGQVGYRLYNGGATAEWEMYQPAGGTGHDYRIAQVVAGSYTDRLTISTGGVVNIPGSLTVAGSAVGLARPGIDSRSTSFTAADSDNNTHKPMSGASRVLTLNSTPAAGTSFTCRFTTAWTITCSSLSKNGATPVANGSVAAGSLITFLHEGGGTWVASGNGLT